MVLEVGRYVKVSKAGFWVLGALNLLLSWANSKLFCIADCALFEKAVCISPICTVGGDGCIICWLVSPFIAMFNPCFALVPSFSPDLF
jgi:hypothetical protein